MGDEGVIVPDSGAVAEDAGLFVRQEDVFVLIDDIELWRAYLEIGILLPGLFKKLVVDIKLQQIPGLEPGVPLGALAVHLDALEADVFLQQALRQQGHRLGDETIQPLAGVVGIDTKFFHKKCPLSLSFFCSIQQKISLDKCKCFNYNT